jgi:hypothetical protein
VQPLHRGLGGVVRDRGGDGNGRAAVDEAPRGREGTAADSSGADEDLRARRGRAHQLVLRGRGQSGGRRAMVRAVGDTEAVQAEAGWNAAFAKLEALLG